MVMLFIISHSPHFKGRRTEWENITDDHDCYNISFNDTNNLTECIVGSNRCMGPLSADSTYYIFLVSCSVGIV